MTPAKDARWLGKLTLKAKMSLRVGLSLLALTRVGAGGWLEISRRCATATLIGEQKLPASIIVGNLRGQTVALLQYVLGMSAGHRVAARETANGSRQRNELAAALIAAMNTYHL